ncbi:MAG: histidine phosphatase family protein [Saprospiraceae bacterium]
MKQITLVRHAKSDWSFANLDDHDRPLNNRGLHDAPFMGQLMASRGWKPDVLISSTAVRAKTTAGFFLEALGYHQDRLLLRKEIYEAPTHTITRLIQGLDDEWQNVALFGHNPTFTLVANMFYPNDFFDNLPTCGIVQIEAPDVHTWQDFSPTTAHVTRHFFPKEF